MHSDLIIIIKAPNCHEPRCDLADDGDGCLSMWRAPARSRPVCCRSVAPSSSQSVRATKDLQQQQQRRRQQQARTHCHRRHEAPRPRAHY
jgi:hypothetical protein